MKGLGRLGMLLQFVALLSSSLCAQSSQWQPTNGPFGGNISAIAVDSKNNLFTAYLKMDTVRGAVIYRSTDDGTSWVPSLALSGQFRTDDIACSRSGDIFVAVSSSRGILYSSDHGASWIRRGENIQSIAAIGVDSQEVIYAGTVGYGNYRSTDKGETWVALSKFPVVDLQPLVRCFAVTERNELFAGTSSGLYRSTDGGMNWIKLSQELPGSDVVSIVFKNTLIFIGIDGINGAGIYGSSDEGSTWKKTATGLPENDGRIFFPQFGRFVTNPVTQDLFVGIKYRGMFRSTNNGDSWEEKDTGLWDDDIVSLMATTQGNLFCATYGGNGIYRSNDDGEHWEVANRNISATSIRSMFLNRKTGSIFARQLGTHMFRTTDYGLAWTDGSNSIPQGHAIDMVVAIDQGELIALEGRGGLYHSIDDGESWQRIDDGTYGDSIQTLCYNPLNGYIFASNINFVYRSTDMGLSWKEIYRAPVYPAPGRIAYVAINREGYLFIPTATDPRGRVYGLASSTDQGITWNLQGFPLVKQMIVTDQWDLFAVTEGGIYQNTSGTEWRYLGSGSCAYRQAGVQYTGYASGWVTVSTADSFYSTKVMGEGFPVSAIVVDKEGYVYAGTDGYGVYRTKEPLIITGVKKNDGNTLREYELEEIYPNPFNPTTTVRFTIAPLPAGGKRDFASLSNSQWVTLKVYNILGEEVATLVNEAKPPGEYSITWNAEALPSGIYLIRMTAGEFQATRKALLIR